MKWEGQHENANRFSWGLTFGFVPPRSFDCSNFVFRNCPNRSQSTVRAFLTLGCQNRHYIGCLVPLAQQVSHHLHGTVDVFKKCLVSCAKIVETRLAFRSVYKTIARALTVASESNFTFTAITWQSIAFGVAECPLLIRGHELHHMLLLNVSQPKLGLHEVIAGIKIAIMLEG